MQGLGDDYTDIFAMATSNMASHFAMLYQVRMCCQDTTRHSVSIEAIHSVMSHVVLVMHVWINPQ